MTARRSPLDAECFQVGMNLMWLRTGEVGGSEHYIVRVLEELARRDDLGFEISVYALASFETAHRELASRFPVVVAPISGRNRFIRVIAENTWLRWRVRRDGMDVMHHAGGTMPRAAGPRPVLTLHDLQYLDHPEYFSKVKRWWLGRVVPRSVSRAAAVVTGSHHTRSRVLESFDVEEARVVVVHHAISPPQIPAPTGESGMSEPYVYLPAWTHPHKNHEVVLRALVNLHDVHLVMTGGRGFADDQVMALIDELGLTERVHRLGHVDERRVEALYADALAVVFPSRYEGFGAPVVEAMVRGVPVVSSKSTALTEIVGDAGLLVDADDVEGWTMAITSVREPQTSAALVARGHLRGATFAPESAGDALTALWKTLSTR